MEHPVIVRRTSETLQDAFDRPQYSEVHKLLINGQEARDIQMQRCLIGTDGRRNGSTVLCVQRVVNHRPVFQRDLRHTHRIYDREAVNPTIWQHRS